MYNYNTQFLFKLAQLFSHFKDEMPAIKAALSKQDGLNGHELFDLAYKVILIAPAAQHDAVELLAIATSKTVEEIHNLEGLVFIEEFRKMVMEFDWERFLKKSMGLAVETQVPAQSQAKSNQLPVKTKK